MTVPGLSLKQARKLAINRQWPTGASKPARGKEGIARTIEHLGYVQIDTISVIERAHHHTLYNRNPDYDEGMLHDLQAVDRRVFEYWGHAASYLPMRDYRFYLPRMKQFLDPHDKWEKQRLEKYGHMMPAVLERIINEGPVCSKDFKPPEGAKKSGWWDWRPTKVALEMLFWQGKLMITERRKFQRVYDLAERVLPEDIDLRLPGDDELGRFAVERAINAYGVASLKDIVDHLAISSREAIKTALNSMLDSGEITGIDIRGIENSSYYTKPEYLNSLSKIRLSKSRVRFLSPFDNFVILRDRVKKLFDFEYSIECYVPAPKRVYGYFVQPILYGDKFIGRMDSKADRKTKTYIIRQLHFENDFQPDDRFLESFMKSLNAMMIFNKCERIKLEKIHHPEFKKILSNRLK